MKNSGGRTACVVAILACSLLPVPLQAGWVRQFSGTTLRLTDVLMLDSVTAIAVGYGKTILKTTDAGQTWIKKSSVGFNLNAVAFKDRTTGLAVGDNRLALFTTDSGETWTQRPIGGIGHFLSAAFVDEGGIFIGTDGGRLHFSTDAGTTWRDTSLGSQAVYRLVFVRGVLEVLYTGFAVTPRLVYKTTDYGASWTSSALPLTFAGSALRGDCDPGGTCYVVGYDGGELPFSRILHRGPFDSAWTTFQFTQPSPSVVVRGVSAPTPTVAYACGSGGLIFRTTDGGDTWAIVSSGVTRRLNAVDFFNAETGFVVGDSGTVLFTTSGTTTVTGGGNGVPAAHALLQNYPNPFNGETTVAYSVEARQDGGRTSLTLHDMLGRQVGTLVNGPHDPGSYTTRLQAGGLASGIYFLRLRTGTITAIRKILLIR